jgi:hypothetical protein
MYLYSSPADGRINDRNMSYKIIINEYAVFGCCVCVDNVASDLFISSIEEQVLLCQCSNLQRFLIAPHSLGIFFFRESEGFVLRHRLLDSLRGLQLQPNHMLTFSESELLRR